MNLNDLPMFLSSEAPFVDILGPAHLIYLAFCITCLVFFVIRRDLVKKHRELVRKIFLGALLFQQVFLLYGWYAFFTPNFLTEGLPLQLCRVASILTIIYLLTKNIALMDIISYFSIFALISLFYPQQVYNFTHISGFSYMINHLITVLIPVYAHITTGWLLNWHSYKRAAISFTLYFIVILIVNRLLNASYFYQVSRPFFHDWPAVLFSATTYVVTVGGFAIVTYIVLLIKKAAHKHTHKKQDTNKEDALV